MKHGDAEGELMARLMAAAEAALAGSPAVREALEDLRQQGCEARLFFVARGAEPGASDDGDAGPGVVWTPEAAPEAEEVTPELTRVDRAFLRSVSIRPDPA